MGKMFLNTLATFAELTVHRVLERHQNPATPSTPGGQ
jgi:hypothetical protein